ncbi:MAG: DUF488 family protein [Gemmatimonadetes bacterium]|nr:DUF488 family protein [Gemmatimonadota bacterium]
MIRLKRVYERPTQADGFRILVERLWPRGLSKQRVPIDLWLKEVAPSPELRTWYGHDPAKWDEFQGRYRTELQQNPAVARIQQVLREKKVVTFVFAARDEEHNSARVLKGFLEERSGR